MRRNLFILTLLLLCVAPASLWAQLSQTDKSLERAISLYNLGHWIEARTELQSMRAELSSVHDRFHIEKIEYYLALCDSQLKMRDAEGRMKRYLAEYGGSAYANDVQLKDGVAYIVLDRKTMDLYNVAEGDTFDMVTKKFNVDKNTFMKDSFYIHFRLL